MSHVTGRYKVAFTQISPFTQSSTASAFTYTWSDLMHELAEPHSVRLLYGVACRSAVMEVKGFDALMKWVFKFYKYCFCVVKTCNGNAVTD